MSDGDKDTGGGDHLGGSGVAERKAVDVAVALKRANLRKPRSRKVLDFTARKRAKQSNASGQPHLPARGQTDTEWLKSILPAPKSGAWWECPADGSGFKIKIRWRVGGQKPVYTFARLGKRELTTLKELTYEEQRSALSARLFGEIFDCGRRDVALRLTPYIVRHQIAGA